MTPLKLNTKGTSLPVVSIEIFCISDMLEEGWTKLPYEILFEKIKIN